MSKTILLADDSVTIQKVVELTFMEEDYQVVAVGNGDEAVARLAELSPAMVVADVHMPGASGYEVCRRAKQGHPGVPVLLLVGTFEPFDEAECEACGADRVLKKPFDSQELLRLAEEMVSAGGGAAEEAESEPDTAEFQPTAMPDLPPAAPAEAKPAAEEPYSLALEQATAEFRVEEPASGEIPLAAEPTPSPVDDAQALSLPEEPSAAPEPEAVAEAAAEPPPPAGPAEVPPPPAATPPPVAEPEAVAASPAEDGAAAPVSLSDADVDRIARRVVELLSDSTVREVTWDVVPDLAEIVIKDRLKELESQVD